MTAATSITADQEASRAGSSIGRRLIAAAVAAACAVVLGLAAWLTPSSAGLGTHEALGMPPCGWVAMADLPCPTCGMTTAFAHAADGALLAAIHAQPLGAVLAIVTAMTFFISLHTAVTGSRLPHVFVRFARPRTGWVVAAAVVLSWGYKVASHKGWM